MGHNDLLQDLLLPRDHGLKLAVLESSADLHINTVVPGSMTEWMGAVGCNKPCPPSGAMDELKAVLRGHWCYRQVEGTEGPHALKVLLVETPLRNVELLRIALDFFERDLRQERMHHDASSITARNVIMSHHRQCREA